MARVAPEGMMLRDEAQSDPGTKELVEVLLSATRALVGVAVRSLGACEAELTLAQYRVLVILCARGPLRLADVADALGITAPNGTRICDRLVRKGLIRRTRSPVDRRSVRISVTPHGREVVGHVSAARRLELRRIVEQLPVLDQQQFIDGLRAFSAAAGETCEDEWALGWGQ